MPLSKPKLSIIFSEQSIPHHQLATALSDSTSDLILFLNLPVYASSPTQDGPLPPNTLLAQLSKPQMITPPGQPSTPSTLLFDQAGTSSLSPFPTNIDTIVLLIMLAPNAASQKSKLRVLLIQPESSLITHQILHKSPMKMEATSSPCPIPSNLEKIGHQSSTLFPGLTEMSLEHTL